MKRNTIVCILLLSAMQIFALPNLIGRWQSAPIWNRFEKTELELNFKDPIHFTFKVEVDDTDFYDGIRTTMMMSGTYQLQDSLCTMTIDTTTFVANPVPLPDRDISDTYCTESFIILPSNNSDDVIALIGHSGREVFVFYRKK